MSRDPYHDFASDLKSSLSSARALSQLYQSLLSGSSSSVSGAGSSRRNSSELESAHDRLQDAIEGLRQDVEDVKQSVLVVERSGPERFGVSLEELRNRKKFVEECEAEIKSLSKTAQAGRQGTRTGGKGGFDAINMDDEDEDATEAFEREQQQILMSRQDNTLDKIGSTLSSLRSQAGMMGQEIGEQIEIIDAFDTEVDQSQGRLSKAMRKMDEVVRISDERLGGCLDLLPRRPTRDRRVLPSFLGTLGPTAQLAEAQFADMPPTSSSNNRREGGSAASSESPSTEGSEPINFRAALAAFESQAQSRPQTGALPVRGPAARTAGFVPKAGEMDKPVNTPTIVYTESKPIPKTPSRNRSSDSASSLDPIARSSSTPRIRKSSDSDVTVFSSNNPFTAHAVSPSLTPSALPPTSPSGMLSAPRSTLSVRNNAASSALRKSESGTSLRELMQQSMPGAGVTDDNVLQRSRSKSLAGNADSKSSSPAASGCSTPAAHLHGSNSRSSSPRPVGGVKNFIALYGGGAPAGVAGNNTATGPYGGSFERTSSPMSISTSNSARTSSHMLDSSADDDYTSPMFGHAVLQPGRSSGLQSSSSSAASRSVPGTPERKNSAASTSSTTAAATSTIAMCDTEISLQPPQIPSRKGSGSSVSSMPRLPPRPSASLAPSPTISEFGQIAAFSSAGNDGAPRKAGNSGAGGVSYATYTPGVRRNGSGASNAAAFDGDSAISPPALPPRSATVGHAYSDRKGTAVSGYAVRQRGAGPTAVSTPTTTPGKAKPAPPPRPTNLSGRQWDGNAGGFRFGSNHTPAGKSGNSSTSNGPAQQPAIPPRPRQQAQQETQQPVRAAGVTAANSAVAGSGHRGHAKSASNVFTSISLSDDASHELRRTLESDMHRSDSSGNALQMPPPSRGRPTHAASRSGGSSIGASASPSGISSLIESAASALPIPLFKSNSNTGVLGNTGTSRSLAEGAPSKQGSVASRSVQGLGFSDVNFLSVRPGESLGSNELNAGSGLARNRPSAVVLAEPSSMSLTGSRTSTLASAKLARSMSPADEAARQRYEALFDALLAAQTRASLRRKTALATQTHSNASTLRGGKTGKKSDAEAASEALSDGVEQDADTSVRSVQSLRGWFESDSSSPRKEPVKLSTSAPEKPSPAKLLASDAAPSTMQMQGRDQLGGGPGRVSAGRVVKVWKRSKLPDAVLAEIWDAAVEHQASGQGRRRSGPARLEREAFVRAMAAIDAELGRRKSKWRRKKAAEEAKLALRLGGSVRGGGGKPTSSPSGSLRGRRTVAPAAGGNDWGPATRLPLHVTRSNPASATSSRSSSRSRTLDAPADSTPTMASAARRVPPPPPIHSHTHS
ncbi:hypothetical protein BCV70DRAFT_237118 [Testicularia cyperi]|uniref:t-SNARE coiled-coil homology domain-containing protein n=1 Tax=Testicularia cyperi TaxID=1882483 RepID=A0A317XTV9_9BASI|nr:hypothetical protein BCV70DRAFT_237118 [Testicularia cyperi]